jgi:hypothetical protein
LLDVAGLLKETTRLKCLASRGVGILDQPDYRHRLRVLVTTTWVGAGVLPAKAVAANRLTDIRALSPETIGEKVWSL